VIIITEFDAGDPEATMHALADEILKYRRADARRRAVRADRPWSSLASPPSVFRTLPPGFAQRNVMESLPDLRPRLHPCGLILAARITLPHFSVSSAISLPNWTGDPGSGVPPRSDDLGRRGLRYAEAVPITPLVVLFEKLAGYMHRRTRGP